MFVKYLEHFLVQAKQARETVKTVRHYQCLMIDIKTHEPFVLPTPAAMSDSKQTVDRYLLNQWRFL